MTKYLNNNPKIETGYKKNFFYGFSLGFFAFYGVFTWVFTWGLKVLDIVRKI